MTTATAPAAAPEAIPERVLRLAREQVERWSGGPAGARQWLGPARVDSYQSDTERTTLWVLEGSPPRGVVLVLSTGDALALSGDGRARRLFHVRVHEALARARPLARRRA